MSDSSCRTDENLRLRQELKARDDLILALQEEIKGLRRKTTMNSSNSSKPPSTDGYRKPKPRSLRAKSGLRPGGQPGHKGHNIEIPHEPDEVIDHLPDRCLCCPRLAECHSDGNISCEDSRFLIDAVMLTKVTEHRRMVANCPMCTSDTREPISGSLPEDLKAHVQYGDSFTVIAGLLDTYGAISDFRISQLLRSFFGVSLSPGTVVNMTARCARKLAPTLEKIRDKVAASKVNNLDETGFNVNGKTHWVHVASTPEYTIQTLSTKRGAEGIRANGIIQDFKGVAVHDCWPSYWMFDQIEHAVCCAHLLRELNGIEEMEPGHRWPGEFRQLLLDMKKARDRAVAYGKGSLSQRQIRRYSVRYDDAIRLALDESPELRIFDGRRGKYLKRGPELSLVERLREHKDSVCLFLRDFDVPFDNNQAERDFRNVKTKMKISGCFRSSGSAQHYLDVMSFLSTARKRGIGMFEAMIAVFEDRTDIIL